MTNTGNSSMTSFRIKGRVRHYAWGGARFIPELLGLPADGRPWAEYWLGAHPSDSAEIVIDNTRAELDESISADPGRWLGQATAREFGQLPYLMKLLDVARPLSIQVHPNLEEAKAGFDRENKAGIALDAPERNFKDANHKPELALAISPFYLLYGFRKNEDIVAALRDYESLQDLVQVLQDKGLKEFFSEVMTADRDQLVSWIQPLWDRCSTADDQTTPQYWIRRWREMHDSDSEAVDRGVLAFLFMNLVKLDPGESIFQGANVPHAYLAGQCVEIMANSDNVLRGGLTPKHVDPEGLVRHIAFDAASRYLSAPPAGLREFRLSLFDSRSPQSISYQPKCLSIVLCLEGQCRIGDVEIRQGESVAIPPTRTANLQRLTQSTAVVLADRGTSDVGM